MSDRRVIGLVALLGGHASVDAKPVATKLLKATPVKTKPRGHQAEAAQSLRLAAEELLKAADAIEALPAGMVAHERKRREMDPKAWTLLAERWIGETKRRMGWV